MIVITEFGKRHTAYSMRCLSIADRDEYLISCKEMFAQIDRSQEAQNLFDFGIWHNTPSKRKKMYRRMDSRFDIILECDSSLYKL